MKNAMPRTGLTPINRRQLARSFAWIGKGKKRAPHIRANVSRNHPDSEKPLGDHVAAKNDYRYGSKRLAY